jgi:hypothetical protein
MAFGIDKNAEEILRVGLTTLFREALIKDSVSQGNRPVAAEQFADAYLKSTQGKDHLKMHLDQKSKELLNEDIVAAIDKNGSFWRGVFVNLFSGAIGAVIGPFVWGLVVLAFALGQNNSALPENKAKEILRLAAPQDGGSPLNARGNR